MLTSKLLCTNNTLGFTRWLLYEVHLDDDGDYYTYDDHNDKRYSPFDEDELESFEIVDVTTTNESCQANDGVANYITSDLATQIANNIKDIIDTKFNGDLSNLKITETVKPVIIDTNGNDIVNVTVTTEIKITRKSLAEKRHDIIKKLYDSGDIVVVKYGAREGRLNSVGLLEYVDNSNKKPYVVNDDYWQYAYAVDLKGNEITEVLDG